MPRPGERGPIDTHHSRHFRERPGTLAKVLDIIARTGGSMKDVRLDPHFGMADPGMVRVFLVVETRDFSHAGELRDALRTAGVLVRE